jgi:hypothetical protein
MRWIDFLDSKPVSGLMLGAVSLGTFTMIDPDWHGVALSFLTVATYWLLFRDWHWRGPGGVR